MTSNPHFFGRIGQSVNATCGCLFFFSADKSMALVVSAQTTIQHAQSDRIVFPDEYPFGRPENTFSRPVPTCANSTYCLDTPYYPSDAEIENALKLRYLEPISEVNCFNISIKLSINANYILNNFSEHKICRMYMCFVNFMTSWSSLQRFRSARGRWMKATDSVLSW